MPFIPFGPNQLQLVATTGPNGFNLVNGTPTILSWTPPNDGNLHRFLWFATKYVSSTETGGAIAATLTPPQQGSFSWTIFSAGQTGPGIDFSQSTRTVICTGGQPVTINQSSALTAGASIMWIELWGS